MERIVRFSRKSHLYCTSYRRYSVSRTENSFDQLTGACRRLGIVRQRFKFHLYSLVHLTGANTTFHLILLIRSRTENSFDQLTGVYVECRRPGIVRLRRKSHLYCTSYWRYSVPLECSLIRSRTENSFDQLTVGVYVEED
jgi:hypothetical protein